MAARLATATVTASLSGQRGRAIVNAKGHHFIVDSPLTLGGPNEEVNPVDLLLSALATHGAFVCERAAQELDFPLKSVSMAVTGCFDPRGVTGEKIDPHMQWIRVRLEFAGVDEAQAETLVGAFQARCPIYATLSRATTVEVAVVVAP